MDRKVIAIWILGFGISAVFAVEPELISAPQGVQKFTPADSARPSISDDGMMVAFESMARLTSKDNNKTKDVYLYDRKRKSLRLMQGMEPTYSNAGAYLSGDGCALAFHSIPRPIKRNIPASTSEIIWQLIDGGERIQITHGSDEHPTDGEALYPSLNLNGERVLFTSNATNMNEMISTQVRSVYVWNHVNGEMALLSHTDDGQPANRASGFPRMSADGRVVAYLSAATNLDKTLPVDSIGTHLYVLDVKEGRTTRLDVFEKGFDPNEWMTQAFDMDAEGLLIVFEGRHRDLINPIKSVEKTDLFVYDASTESIKLLTTGLFANRSHTPSLSADGRFIAFILGPDGTSKDKGGLVIYDRSQDEWRRAVDGPCARPVMAKNGGFITFEKKEKKITNIYVVANPFAEAK